jgi:hypothetical protein
MHLSISVVSDGGNLLPFLIPFLVYPCLLYVAGLAHLCEIYKGRHICRNGIHIYFFGLVKGRESLLSFELKNRESKRDKDDSVFLVAEFLRTEPMFFFYLQTKTGPVFLAS